MIVRWIYVFVISCLLAGHLRYSALPADQKMAIDRLYLYERLTTHRNTLVVRLQGQEFHRALLASESFSSSVKKFRTIIPSANSCDNDCIMQRMLNSNEDET